ncbi:MAG: mechanosensitive ion channel domain-containing protein [Candidatus Aminicenantaceae bacterium]
MNIVIPIVELPQGLNYFLDSAFRSLFIISVSWLIIALTAVGEDVILSRYDVNVKDNLQARKIYTQTQTIRKILAVVIIIVAVALVLMGFERFRVLGTGIIASAGLASLVIGFAAQKIFGNFLAGIQIAFTQPIRVDDVVIVENEWGRIEEITLTYVVVRIWDLRRLVLPIGYFIEKPFQNWTRVSADLLGTVFIYADYTIPVNEIREELHRILKSSDKWDSKVWGLQVTNATERTMELRALMSAVDSSTAWGLRCEVREKIIEFVQKNYPETLPKTRAELKKTEVDNI